MTRVMNKQKKVERGCVEGRERAKGINEGEMNGRQKVEYVSKGKDRGSKKDEDVEGEVRWAKSERERVCVGNKERERKLKE